jgi:hypothetical protein
MVIASNSGRGLRPVNTTATALIRLRDPAQRAEGVDDDEMRNGEDPLDDRSPPGDLPVGFEVDGCGVDGGGSHG